MRAIAMDQIQPDQRMPHEDRRRRQNAGGAEIERLENIAEQALIVKMRRPAHEIRALVMAKAALDHPLVGHDIAMGDHHPLGPAG